MGSSEPVVEAADNTPISTSNSARNLNQRDSKSYDQQIASHTLATFPLRNTSDAIRLLDQAEVNSDNRMQHMLDAQQNLTLAGTKIYSEPSSSTEFFLLHEGLIDKTTIFKLFSFYMRSVHPIMPLIPHERMQITPEHVLTMANREPHLMAAILVVTASLAGDQTLHDLLWQRVRILFAEVAIEGENASTEVVEAFLLLSGTTTILHASG